MTVHWVVRERAGGGAAGRGWRGCAFLCGSAGDGVMIGVVGDENGGETAVLLKNWPCIV